MRDLISKKDRNDLARKLYDALKRVNETPSNPIKNFNDLTLEDISNENGVFLCNDYVCQTQNKGNIPMNWIKDGGWNQEKSKALASKYVIKLVKPLFAVLQYYFPDHPKLQGNSKH